MKKLQNRSACFSSRPSPLFWSEPQKLLMDCRNCRTMKKLQKLQSDEEIAEIAGLPNGGSLEDGLLPSDQRSGRRNRRQKCAARLNQPVLSEKENLELKPLGEAHDSFHAHQKLPLAAKLGMPPKTFPATTDSVI